MLILENGQARKLRMWIMGINKCYVPYLLHTQCMEKY
jgi:hypothetical protein